MNEPACRAYRSAILPTFLHSRPNPKFNPKTKPNTNPIAADTTYTELQASSVTQIVCTRHFVQILGQVQHTNNKSTTPTSSPQVVVQQIYATTNCISGVWALMSMAVRSALSRSVRRIEWHTYITSPHRWHTCQAAYTISQDVRHSLTYLIGTARRDRVGLPPTSPARLSCSE